MIDQFNLGGMLNGFKSTSGLQKMQATSDILSGLGSYQANQTRAASGQISAMNYRAQATNEQVMGQTDVTNLKQQYLSSVGRADSQIAGGGLDVGQGVAQATRQTIGQNAAAMTNVTNLAASIRANRDNMAAIEADASAKQAQAAGMLSLIGAGFSAALPFFGI